MEKKREENKKRSGKTRPEPKSMDRESMIADLLRLYPTKKYSLKNLAAASGGADREGRYATRDILERMIADGYADKLSGDKYRLSAANLPTFEGEADMISSGALYVRVEGLERDIFVRERNSGHALHGDMVKVALMQRQKGGSPEGEIVGILRRNDRKYVGVVELSKGYAFVRVDSRKVPVDIFVPLRGDTDLKNGQKVLVRVVRWDEDDKSPQGEIVDILGMSGDNDTEMHAILAEYDLPYRFEKEVEDAADAIAGEITAQDHAERRDMRGVPTFTIDPADAKDFDDALSIRRLDNGNWEVGVHIADVTHYVRPDTVVESEAVSRATSVYLVDRTVPMLPERLSNELCSLRPGEEKLTFSAVFEMTNDARLVGQWLGRTVTYSDRRFTYEEAQAVIEAGQGGQTDYQDEILTLNHLARQLRAERFRQGAISFEREEAKFRLDDNGRPLGVYFKAQKESNRLIEEFMLLANRKVAEFVGKKRGEGANAERTFVYRVHDKPNPDKLASFKSFIMRFGYDLRIEKPKEVSREMNRLMERIKGKVEENVVSTLAIRTMAKACYSTDNTGHYGLAFDHYTHFTSPIRRYPDMMVHRLLARYLAGGRSADRDTCEGLCEHSSDMEVRAAEAERASIKYKMAEFMTDKIGSEFDGTISGITEWGIYVELEQTHIEGMAALRDMTDDFYVFHEDDYAVKGQSTGRVFTLGDRVRIEVLRADLARKQIDFRITASYDFATGRTVEVEDRHNARAPLRGGSQRRRR